MKIYETSAYLYEVFFVYFIVLGVERNLRYNYYKKLLNIKLYRMCLCSGQLIQTNILYDTLLYSLGYLWI
jgi:hypothetical protein